MITTEESQALGFDSVEQAEEHQVFLDQRKAEAEKARRAVKIANETNSPYIDIR